MKENLFDIRDKEKAQILGYLKDYLNTVVCGPSGVGKTTLMKTVAEEINDRLGQCVCIDCSIYQTPNAVLREILLALGSVIASKSNYDLTKRLREKTRKVRLFVFLDHFEGLNGKDILSILLGLDFCVCLVADSFESYRAIGLTQRAKITNIMRIEKPTANQISEILRECSSSKTSDELIQRITEKSDGNLTLALNTLKGIEANGKSTILDESLETCTNCNEDHSIILQILKQKDSLPSGELYRLYHEKSEYPKSERSFRNLMQSLNKQGFVRSIGEKRGRFYQMTKSEVTLSGA
jgi:Cdc6-like AAA superfamily ATPase